MILRGADHVMTPDSVTILGGAAAYNIPLEELARRFNTVRIVDIDRSGLERVVEGLNGETRRKLEVHVGDATGGLAVRLLGRGLDILRMAETPSAALTQLVALFNGQEPDMIPDPDYGHAWKASYVVSSGLSSQSTIFPEKAILETFRDRFGSELDQGFFFKRGTFHLRNKWVRSHGEFLASLVPQEGRVYWADTVAETPCLNESGEGPLDAILDSVVSFLNNAYLKTLLTDPGKQVLAERIAERLPLTLASDGDGRRRQAEQVLQSFNGKLAAEKKRLVAWAVMTLVGEDRISPRRELELLGYIVREAERMNPQARQPILGGGKLSTFFPSSLEADSEMGSWTWINDPEGTVSLNGHSYYVEAFILRRKPC